MSSLRPVLLAALLAAALVPGVAPAAQAAPVPGIVATLPMSNGDLAAIAALHVRVVRVFLYSRGYDDAGVRSAVSRLATIGAKPLFVVVGDPRAPDAPSAYAAFLRARAAEFRGRVAAWEIWNEPDAPEWWAGATAVDAPVRDASAYTQLLIAAHTAVRAVDATTPVILGGLTGNDFAFLEAVYRSGGRGAFDGVAVHTDTACNLVSPNSFQRGLDGRIGQFSFLGFHEVHDVMARNGDGGKGIWMTELGWSTAGGLCDVGRWAGQKAGGVSEATQARFLTRAFHCLSTVPYVRSGIVFSLRDGQSGAPAHRFGVLRSDGTRKPAFAAVEAVARHGDRLRGGCGDFSGPRISVAAPRRGHRFAKDLRIRVSARDGAGVARITLLADGHKIRNFTSRSAPRRLVGRIDWQGAKRLAAGRHRITVIALDRGRNVASRTIVVTKVRR